MDVRRENQDEKEEEIQLMLTENLNKTHPLVSKSPIRTEKVKIIVSDPICDHISVLIFKNGYVMV